MENKNKSNKNDNLYKIAREAATAYNCNDFNRSFELALELDQILYENNADMLNLDRASAKSFNVYQLSKQAMKAYNQSDFDNGLKLALQLDQKLYEQNIDALSLKC